MTLRIVVWNARMDFPRKRDALMNLGPDIAVVPECDRDIEASSYSSVWVGSIPSKGLATFGFGEYQVSLDPAHDDSIKEVAPVWVIKGSSRFFVLAVWSQRPYGEAIQHALVTYRAQLLAGPSVVAGDFNTNVMFDKAGRERNHGRTVQLLDELGLSSAYHAHTGAAQGSETQSTLHWSGRSATRNTYHIDYCFLPKAWLPGLRAVSLGLWSDWDHLSDHVPLIVDVDVA